MPIIFQTTSFASLSSVMKDNFLGQKLPERTNQSANFWCSWVLGSNFTKFLLFLKQQISFSSVFFYHTWVPSNRTPLYFLIWSIIYFGQKHPIKVQICEIFECLVQNLLNLSCQFWTSQFLFKFCIFITHNSPVSFKLVHFLLGMKVPHKIFNFESQRSSALVKICQISVIF